MTTNLLSVIEQQQKALKLCRNWFIDELGFTGRHPIVSDASAALAAGKQALEQTQAIAGAVASIYVTADGDREMDDWREPLPVGRNLLYTRSQATEPAPIGFNGLTQAETEATMSVRGLSEPAPSTAGERAKVIEDLLMYAGDNGYSHIDYADTMRHAAALLSAPALPVGELTLLDTPEPDKYVDCGEARPLPMFHLSTLLQYGARIAAARTQPARELLTDSWILERCAQSWVFETAKQWVRMAEAAHGIK